MCGSMAQWLGKLKTKKKQKKLAREWQKFLSAAD